MKVIIINGPMGVGKTTVGKYIAEKWEGTAFIDGDWCLDLHPFVVLVCNENNLIDRWKKDKKCEWRTQEWLEISLKSLLFFSSLQGSIDTSDLAVDIVANMVVH